MPGEEQKRFQFLPTIQMLLFGGVAAFIGSAITWNVTHFLDSRVADEKILRITLLPSQNLAAFPQDVGNELEVRLLVQPNKPEAVKSLFGYQVTILNESEKGLAEDISLFVYPPAGVTLLKPPKLTTRPESLAHHIQKETREINNGIGFKLEYLQAQQSATYSFIGYSSDNVGTWSTLKAEAKAKDWRQAFFQPSTITEGYIGSYSDYPRGNEYGFQQTKLKFMSDAASLIFAIGGVFFAFFGLAVALFRRK